MVDQGIDQAEIIRGHDTLAMIGVEALRYRTCVARLVERLLVKADRAGLDRPTTILGHQGDHCAAVDPAREKGSQRHVGNHPRVYRLLEQLDQFFLKISGRPLAPLAEIHIPILYRFRFRLALLEQKIMTGGEFLHALQQGCLIRHIAKGEIVIDCRDVRVAA